MPAGSWLDNHIQPVFLVGHFWIKVCCSYTFILLLGYLEVGNCPTLQCELLLPLTIWSSSLLYCLLSFLILYLLLSILFFYIYIEFEGNLQGDLEELKVGVQLYNDCNIYYNDHNEENFWISKISYFLEYSSISS